MTAEKANNSPARIALIDAARGVALLAMAVFHFTFDLELFRQIASGTINQPGWILFARSIASSFLFLAGFSLVLAHGNGIDWQKMKWRMIKLIAACAAITVATFFATPNMYIFFGILHQIAFASVAGLLFLKLPWIVTLLVGLGFIAGRAYLRTDFLDAPIWWWTGLQEITPISSDYVPVFPWFGVVLIGMAAAQFSRKTGFDHTLARPSLSGRGGSALQTLGRWSLTFYLVHQPVLIAGLVSVLWLTGRI